MFKMLRYVDIGGDGKIQFSEFMAAASDKDKLLSETNLNKTFNFFDINQDGRIDLFDIYSMLKLTPEETEIEKADYRVDMTRIYN